MDHFTPKSNFVQGARHTPIYSARRDDGDSACDAEPSLLLSYELHLRARRARALAVGDALARVFAAGLRWFRRQLRQREDT